MVPVPADLVVELDQEDAVIGDVDEATWDQGMIRVVVPETLYSVDVVTGQVRALFPSLIVPPITSSCTPWACGSATGLLSQHWLHRAL